MSVLKGNFEFREGCWSQSHLLSYEYVKCSVVISEVLCLETKVSEEMNKTEMLSLGYAINVLH